MRGASHCAGIIMLSASSACAIGREAGSSGLGIGTAWWSQGQTCVEGRLVAVKHDVGGMAQTKSMKLQRKIRYAGFMTTDESRNPTDGAAWENCAAERLRAHHAAADQRTELVAVPADDGGDLGVDLFTRTGGTLYQCYVARDWNSAHDLYEKQRDKLTEDVGKLLKPDKQKDLRELFGATVIKEWILVVPKHRSRKLIQHANIKAQELKADPSRPAFLDPDIIIHVWTEADLRANTHKASAAWDPRRSSAIRGAKRCGTPSCGAPTPPTLSSARRRMSPGCAGPGLTILMKTMPTRGVIPPDPAAWWICSIGWAGCKTICAMRKRRCC